MNEDPILQPERTITMKQLKEQMEKLKALNVQPPTVIIHPNDAAVLTPNQVQEKFPDANATEADRTAAKELKAWQEREVVKLSGVERELYSTQHLHSSADAMAEASASMLDEVIRKAIAENIIPTLKPK